MKKADIRLSCLLCGREFNRQGWSGHQRAKNHQDRGNAWWTYNRSIRLMMARYKRAALDLLKTNFTFTESIEPRVGKTVQWFRYKTNA